MTSEAEDPTKRSRRQKVKDSIARVQVQDGGFGGSFWYLYSDRLETHDGFFSLSNEVTAAVDNEVKRQFAPGKLLAKTIAGLVQRIAQRLLALTIGMFLNTLLGRPPRALAAYDER